MQINSLIAIGLFLPIMILYYIVPYRVRNGLLVLVSILFYSTFGVRFLAFLTGTVFLIWLSALIIHKKGREKILSRIVFWITVFVFVCVFAVIRTGTIPAYLIPIGFSFYTLQALGYLVDVFKGKREPERNIINFTLYVSFFATVTAGPIQQSDSFLKQINKRKPFEYDAVRRGLLRIAYGLFVKNVIADQLAPAVNYAFDYCEAQTGMALLLGAIFFAIQLYCDFSGYSNIAIGMAEALGFGMKENFCQPYFSKSIKEFWGRWHISLSEWLKDYVYIPCGGNRKGKVATIRNILIVFLVSGIWHGTGLQYIVWGLLHGIYRATEQIVGFLKPERKASESESSENKKTIWAGRLLSLGKALLCFAAVDFAWIFFRAGNLLQAFEIIRKIALEFQLGTSLCEHFILLGLSKRTWICLAVSLLVVLAVDILQYRKISVSGLIQRVPVALRWCGYAAFIIFMILFSLYNYGGDASAFIYTQF